MVVSKGLFLARSEPAISGAPAASAIVREELGGEFTPVRLAEGSAVVIRRGVCVIF